jgi:hypothetical protein
VVVQFHSPPLDTDLSAAATPPAERYRHVSGELLFDHVKLAVADDDQQYLIVMVPAHQAATETLTR